MFDVKRSMINKKMYNEMNIYEFISVVCVTYQIKNFDKIEEVGKHRSQTLDIRWTTWEEN